MNQKKVSCLIPAFNEEKRIGNVLKAACFHPLIDEIIVIDDASTDNTAGIVSRFSTVRLLHNQKNLGKSGAILNGIKAAKNDYLLFLDADLIGLKPAHLTRLIEPVLNDEVDVTISLRKNSFLPYRELGLDFISGERVFRKSLIRDYGKLSKLPGFALEVFLNERIIKKKLRIRVIRWDEVISPYPDKKFGLAEGTKRFLNMVENIEEMIGISGIARQIIEMKKLAERDLEQTPRIVSGPKKSRTRQKLLFFYLKTGGGHLSCARSLADYLTQTHGKTTEVVLCDGLGDSKRIRKFFFEDSYMLAQSYARWYHNLSYNILTTPPLWSQLRKVARIVFEVYAEKRILEEMPDKIVILHPFIIPAVESILRKNRLKIPIIAVVTDPYSAPPPWFGSKTANYVVFSKRAQQTAITKKTPLSRCHVVDNYILNPRYDRRMTPQQIKVTKRKLGFPPNRKIVLIVGGGDGIPKGIPILRALLKGKSNTEIAMVWGRNESLKKLSEKLFANRKNLHLYGFVNNVYELINIADVVITKGGPAILLEILLQGKIPLINSYLVQEEGNVEFVAENKVGFYEPRVSRLPQLVKQVLGSKAIQENFSRNLAKIHLKNGTPEVGEYILNFVEKKPK